MAKRKSGKQGPDADRPQSGDQVEMPPLGEVAPKFERTLADLEAFLEDREFGSIDEARDFLDWAWADDDPFRGRPTSPLGRAQDLMWDAWDTDSKRGRVKLAREALEITADCADAYVMLAIETTKSPQEAADLYAKGVAAAERSLGADVESLVGQFWGAIETRPYMRARYGLAQSLWDMGRGTEAIAQAWDMLRLNPNDNQGIRYILLTWLLEVRDPKQIDQLLRNYTNDGTADWLFARTLHYFRMRGDTRQTRALLRQAMATNPYVVSYLTGRRRIPRRLPDYVDFGGESEAVSCAAAQVNSWRNTPGALAWLRANRGDMPHRDP